MQRFSPGFPTTVLEQLRMRRQRAGQPPMTDNMGQPGVSVASYNVHKCVGTDGRFDPERTFRVIHEIDADVVALQEADRRFGNREGLLDLARLERETGLALFDAIGSADKTLHAFPGSHFRVPEERVDTRFFARQLAGSRQES